jgi:hypothetical protein
MAIITSTFDGTETILSESGLWTSGHGAWADVTKAVAGLAQAASLGVDCGARLNTTAPGATIGPNHYAKVTVNNAAGPFDGHICAIVRSQGANASAYQANASNVVSRIFKITDTGTLAFAQLGTNTSITRTPGDTIELRAQGPILHLLYNNVSIMTVYDTSWPTGQPGMTFSVNASDAAANHQSTAWEGGDLPSGNFAIAGVVESIRTDTLTSYTYSHNVGTTAPRGILIAAMHGGTSTDHLTGLTYGGQTLTRVRRDATTAAEPGASEWWFRGTGIPTGTQDVVVSLSSATGDDIHFVSVTLDGDNDMEIIDHDGIGSASLVANPSVTLQYGGRMGLAFAAQYSGLTAPTSITITPPMPVAKISSLDLAGNFTAAVSAQASAQTADFTYTHTSASDDCTFSAVVVAQIVAAPASLVLPVEFPRAMLVR